VVDENDLFAAFNRLHRKIGSLRTAYDATKEQVKTLQDENKSLRKKNREQEAELKQLNKKQSNSEKIASKSKDFGKIVNNNLSGTDTNAELKQQLDEYIQELERCIAHLSSLS
jgi:regulator of replication initiation timing